MSVTIKDKFIEDKFYRFIFIMSQIKGILGELQRVKSKKNKGDLQRWAESLQNQMQELEQNQKDYYYLLLAEVYAVNLANITKAYECLKKIQSKSQVVIFEHQLRQCYFRFLQGDYDEAINLLSMIKVTKENSPQSSKITRDFFQRLMPKFDEQDELVNGKDEEDRQGYEYQYFKALKQQSNKQIDKARQTHQKIYSLHGDSVSIKYQAAKHIVMLGSKTNKKLRDEKQYERVIAQFEQSVQNKQYYFKKVEFLTVVLDILEEDEEQQPVNYQLIYQFVLQMIENCIKNTKDKNAIVQLKELRIALLQQPTDAEQICYKFFGDKVYKKLVKQQKQKSSKHVIIKQQSIKQQQSKKIKKTYSQQSEDSFDQNFTGSVMTKINMNSGGYQDRYFYIRQDFRSTKKLFYCKKKGKVSSDDDFYRLKGFKKIELGKRTQALQRDECEDFEEDQCFTLKIDGEQVYQRNFYVADKSDFKNWIGLFKSMAEKPNKNVSASNANIKKTVMLM